MISNLFPTKKSSTEGGKVWETMADKLCAFRQPTFRVDQRSVRDHYKKIINRHKRRMDEEKAASGINPERTETNVLLEVIIEREEVVNAQQITDKVREEKKEADKVAVDDMRERPWRCYPKPGKEQEKEKTDLR